MDQEKIKQAVSSILEAIGEDPAREGLVQTPRRIAEMYAEFFSGLDRDPATELTTSFEEDYREIVILKDIPFFSICEHHFLPFHGTADIGYIPRGRVVGASKFARALDVLSHRPQLQERLTDQLADTIFETMLPDGVVVLLTAEHMCMSLRGVRKIGGKIVTMASRGSLEADVVKRQEFLMLMRQG